MVFSYIFRKYEKLLTRPESNIKHRVDGMLNEISYKALCYAGLIDKSKTKKALAFKICYTVVSFLFNFTQEFFFNGILWFLNKFIFIECIRMRMN